MLELTKRITTNLNMKLSKMKKSLYNLLKKQMGWKQSALRLGNNIARKPESIANIKNDFYNKKITDLNSKLPVTGTDPLQVLQDALSRWGPKARSIKKLTLQPVGTDVLFISNTFPTLPSWLWMFWDEPGEKEGDFKVFENYFLHQKNWFLFIINCIKNALFWKRER